MDPNSGRLYTEAEMADLSEARRAELVELKGKREDIERISQAVQAMNRAERRAAGQRGPKQP
jgi:hypothetical protein